MPAAGLRHPGEESDRGGRVAGVEGVGQLPRRDVTGLAEERLHVLRRQRGGRAERSGERGEDAVESPDVLAEAFRDPARRRR